MDATVESGQVPLKFRCLKPMMISILKEDDHVKKANLSLFAGLDDRYWNGLIDDFRIYYRALTEQEISGL